MIRYSTVAELVVLGPDCDDLRSYVNKRFICNQVVNVSSTQFKLMSR